LAPVALWRVEHVTAPQGMIDRPGDSWPSIGVIMPNHVRVQETLDALSSVTKQSYAGTIRVYLAYEKRGGVESLLGQLDPEVVTLGYVPRPSENPIAAKRNLALDATVEDLVAFLDDDDMWHPDKLRLQVDALRASPDALGCCSSFLTFSDQPDWQRIREQSVVARRLSEHDVLRASRIATSAVLLDGVTARTFRFDERPTWRAAEDFDL